ncbi:cytochrome P450 [Microthyrium microscopicum]|uniref:Cytochrome P450 n=1 Tax=Microthyrium microscopicum TaxID=703497 RepID=A0A6A6ULX4_9PEZI|nr:cytochrome P450 [Microthyrium microscopicum]
MLPYSSIWLVGIAAVIYGLAYFTKRRNESKDLPQPRGPDGRSFIWGNMPVAGECMKLFPPTTHMHNWPHYIAKRWKTGPLFYLDMWPLGPRFLFMSDPELISQYITTTQSLPKSSLETDFLDRFLGKLNMVSSEGSHWKRLRSMFNPGFSASHLMTMVPYIVDSSMVFLDILNKKAETGELFELEDVCTKLTIDIIGKVVLDSDFNSQKATHPIVDTFRTRIGLMPDVTSIYPWAGLDLFRPYRLWKNERKLNGLIAKELERKIQAREASKTASSGSAKNRKKSVVDLALDGYEKELSESGKAGGAKVMVDARTRADIVDSMKTFIFAGHDTTASTLSYIYYMLHLLPSVYNKFCKELDTVFGVGTSPAAIAEMIKKDHHIVNKLEYGNAIIKEALRMFPPASTLRHIPAASDPSKIVFITDPKSGRKFPISGWHVWPAVHFVSRNEEFFPDPHHFIPERFIQAETPFPEAKLFTPAGKEAWRPFERGPRNCIGQELAMIESRVILALAVRGFDFVSEIDGVKTETWTPIDTVSEFEDGRPGTERQTIEGHRCYQILRAAAKPKGGMPGRLSKRKVS